MSAQPATIQVLTDYYAAFNTLDVRAFLPYFHEPCLLIGPAMFVAPTHAVLATAFAPAIADLRARGFSHSELSLRHAQTLSETARLVTGVAIRQGRWAGTGAGGRYLRAAQE